MFFSLNTKKPGANDSPMSAGFWLLIYFWFL